MELLGWGDRFYSYFLEKVTMQAHKSDLMNLPALYDRDFALWTDTTVELLKAKQFQHIDLENLIEEIESMGKSQKSAIRNNLIVVLLHLLKWQYQPDRRSKSWSSSILEHRRRLRDDFLDTNTIAPTRYPQGYSRKPEISKAWQVAPARCVSPTSNRQ